jgi:hypothetical protein
MQQKVALFLGDAIMLPEFEMPKIVVSLQVTGGEYKKPWTDTLWCEIFNWSDGDGKLRMKQSDLLGRKPKVVSGGYFRGIMYREKLENNGEDLDTFPCLNDYLVMKENDHKTTRVVGISSPNYQLPVPDLYFFTLGSNWGTGIIPEDVKGHEHYKGKNRRIYGSYDLLPIDNPESGCPVRSMCIYDCVSGGCPFNKRDI